MKPDELEGLEDYLRRLGITPTIDACAAYREGYARSKVQISRLHDWNRNQDTIIEEHETAREQMQARLDEYEQRIVDLECGKHEHLDVRQFKPGGPQA